MAELSGSHLMRESGAGQASDAVKIAWWVVFVQGIAAVILGLFLLARPAITVLVLVQFIGVWWLLTGVLALVHLFWDRAQWGAKIAMGVLGILAGLAVIGEPMFGALVIGTFYVIWIGVMGLLIGVLDLYKAFSGHGWGAGVLGVLSILIALVLIASPVSAALALPLVLGALAIVFGAASIVGAIQLKKALGA
jgi:uncharacterized membrane protein HdeD (DUF308 family)